MEFNASTFFLEIINFLILIWILQRLFYKPILEIIAKRKQHIDQSLEEAKTLHQEADEMRNLYENRQKHWEQEKKAALAELHRQIENERSAQLQKLQIDLEQERQKAKVALSRQQKGFQLQVEKQALLNGARFAGILLQQAAGPELEERFLSMMINHFEDLPDICRLCCLEVLDSEQKGLLIKVSSAYPLTLKLRGQLESGLAPLINCPLTFRYHQDSDLIAGIRLDIGAWVLHANLKHELAGFAEMAYESE